jgi:hypothetical protein
MSVLARVFIECYTFYTSIDLTGEIRVSLGSAMKWFLILVCGLPVGIWYGNNMESLSPVQSLMILGGSVLLLSLFVSYAYMIYVIRFTKNNKEVEAYLKKAAKHPYYSVLNDVISGKYEKARVTLPRIKNPQLRAIGTASLMVELKNVTEAKQATDQIKNSDIRHVNYANIAMLQEDWAVYEAMKDKVKRPVFKYALDADAAYKRNNFEEAKRWGDLAISNSSGLQRYIFIKLLELKQNDPNRESYF